MDWQPIETAPKDKPILAFGGRPDHHHDENFDWFPEPPQPAIVVLWWNGDDWRHTSYDGEFYGAWEDPTHWMPLPEAPK